MKLLRIPPAVALLSSAALLVAACPPPQPEGEEPLETVEVDDPTAGLTPEDDPVAAPRARGFVGVLPGHFPQDLPRPETASVVDFSESGSATAAGDAGRAFVELSTSRGVVETTRFFDRRLTVGAGWRRPGEGSYRHGERDIRITVRAGRPGETLIRYEYPQRAR